MNTVTRKPQWRLLWAAFFGVFAFAIVALLIGQAVRHEIERQELEAQIKREWLTAQLADLRSGKTDGVYFYCTESTDESLREFRGMPEVRDLSFNLTDISTDGMSIVAAFPELRRLTLYGGRPSVDDNGLRRLAGKETLEELALINTNVTDDGLKVLKTLPNLRSLVLFRESRREVRLTDAGLLQLQDLDDLEKLDISGGWASDAAIQKLKAALPNCKISTAEFSN